MPWNRPIPDSNPRGKASGIVDAIVQAEKLIQVALVLPCAAFIGWLGGAWLDSRLHQHWIGIAGIVVGGISGLVYVIRLAMTTMGEVRIVAKKEDGDEEGNSNSKP